MKKIGKGYNLIVIIIIAVCSLCFSTQPLYSHELTALRPPFQNKLQAAFEQYKALTDYLYQQELEKGESKYARFYQGWYRTDAIFILQYMAFFPELFDWPIIEKQLKKRLSGIKVTLSWFSYRADWAERHDEALAEINNALGSLGVGQKRLLKKEDIILVKPSLYRAVDFSDRTSGRIYVVDQFGEGFKFALLHEGVHGVTKGFDANILDEGIADYIASKKTGYKPEGIHQYAVELIQLLLNRVSSYEDNPERLLWEISSEGDYGKLLASFLKNKDLFYILIGLDPVLAKIPPGHTSTFLEQLINILKTETESSGFNQRLIVLKEEMFIYYKQEVANSREEMSKDSSSFFYLRAKEYESTVILPITVTLEEIKEILALDSSL